MNADVFAEWLRRQGYKVVRTPSSYWAEAGPHILQAFPYHWLVDPNKDELCQLLTKDHAIGLRYSAPWTAAQGVASYHVVYHGNAYSLDTLPKKARYDVRKGLESASVEPISFSRSAVEGWELRVETLARQGRAYAESQAWWKNLCQSTQGLGGFETWGAVDRRTGKLGASLIAFTCDNCCSVLYQQSRTDYLSEGVNNALAFVFTSEVLKRSTVGQVFYGLHSLDAPASVDRFKFRMGYTAKPVRQRVVFHPWLAPLFGRGSHTVVRHLLRWQPGNPTLAKAEGMIRFYLGGKQPLSEQEWPEALADRRFEIVQGLT
jgi:hypothetical protein